MNKLWFGIVIAIILLAGAGCEDKSVKKTEVMDYHFDLVSIPYANLFHQYSYVTSSYNATPADSNGVQIYFRDGIYHYHPVQIAHKCLDLISDFRLSDDVKYLNRAIISAETLRSHAIRYKGGIYFPYTFDYNVLEKPELYYPQPWISGMAQGMLLSTYSRLYYLTENELYHSVADSILTTFNDYSSPYSPVFISQEDGVGKGKGYFWVDEYPFPSKVYVLNGSIIGAMGIYDHWWVFGDAYSKKLMSRELTTIKDHILLYRNPQGSSKYELKYNTVNTRYHSVHISLMRNCYAITGDAFFLAMADLFNADYHEK